MAIRLDVITATVAADVLGDRHNSRTDVSGWFRAILLFDRQPELMT